MVRTSGYIVILVFAICFNSFLPICSAAEMNTGLLVSEQLLQRANLGILWQYQITTRKTDNMSRLLLLGDCLFVITDRNYMVCLDRLNGGRIFHEIVAPAGLEVGNLQLFGDKLISSTDGIFAQINPSTGQEISVMDMGFGIVGPVALNDTYIYMAGVDQRLHSFNADNMVSISNVAPENGSKIVSIIADESFVLFGTDMGNLVCITPDETEHIWDFTAAGGIVGQIVRDGMSFYFSCKDMHVYRVDMIGISNYSFLWKTQMPSVLDKEPRVTQDYIYQHVSDKGVVAMDKNNGEILWTLPEGIDLLAEDEGRAYILVKNGTLAVMDNTKKSKLYSVNFAGVSKYVSNTVDSRIYIADENGRIACLQPIQ